MLEKHNIRPLFPLFTNSNPTYFLRVLQNTCNTSYRHNPKGSLGTATPAHTLTSLTFTQVLDNHFPTFQHDATSSLFTILPPSTKILSIFQGPFQDSSWITQALDAFEIILSVVFLFCFYKTYYHGTGHRTSVLTVPCIKACDYGTESRIKSRLQSGRQAGLPDLLN